MPVLRWRFLQGDALRRSSTGGATSSHLNAAGLLGGCLRSSLPAGHCSGSCWLPAISLRSSLPAGDLLPPKCHRLARWMLRSSLPAGHCSGAVSSRLFLLRSSLPAGDLLPPKCHRLPGGCLRSSLPAGHCSGAVSSRRISLRSSLPAGDLLPPKCHRIARWMLTLVATRRPLLRELLAPGY